MAIYRCDDVSLCRRRLDLFEYRSAAAHRRRRVSRSICASRGPGQSRRDESRRNSQRDGVRPPLAGTAAHLCRDLPGEARTTVRRPRLHRDPVRTPPRTRRRREPRLWDRGGGGLRVLRDLDDLPQHRRDEFGPRSDRGLDPQFALPRDRRLPAEKGGSMTAVLRGTISVVIIMLVAGFIAYVGDRVGHQVGRRRMTLFNLRPRHTSTIVAVATGMLIALLVTIIAMAASEYVQTALFRIGDLNAQMRELQTKVASLQQEVYNTRNQPRILPFGEPIWNEFLILEPSQSQEQQYDALRAFFDDTVKAANKAWLSAGLRPFPQTSADPEVQRKLHQQLDLIQPQLARAPVLLLPVASQNLFRGDEIGFEFDQYSDVRIINAHEVIASIAVSGGGPVDFPRLIALARDAAIRRGMPPPFVTFPLVNGPQAQSIAQEVAHSRGNFLVVAKAAQDTYPHSRALILDFGIESR